MDTQQEKPNNQPPPEAPDEAAPGARRGRTVGDALASFSRSAQEQERRLFGMETRMRFQPAVRPAPPEAQARAGIIFQLKALWSRYRAGKGGPQTQPILEYRGSATGKHAVYRDGGAIPERFVEISRNAVLQDRLRRKMGVLLPEHRKLAIAWTFPEQAGVLDLCAVTGSMTARLVRLGGETAPLLIDPRVFNDPIVESARDEIDARNQKADFVTSVLSYLDYLGLNVLKEEFLFLDMNIFADRFSRRVPIAPELYVFPIEYTEKPPKEEKDKKPEKKSAIVLRFDSGNPNYYRHFINFCFGIVQHFYPGDAPAAKALRWWLQAEIYALFNRNPQFVHAYFDYFTREDRRKFAAVRSVVFRNRITARWPVADVLKHKAWGLSKPGASEKSEKVDAPGAEASSHKADPEVETPQTTAPGTAPAAGAPSTNAETPQATNPPPPQNEPIVETAASDVKETPAASPPPAAEATVPEGTPAGVTETTAPAPATPEKEAGSS